MPWCDVVHSVQSQGRRLRDDTVATVYGVLRGPVGALTIPETTAELLRADAAWAAQCATVAVIRGSLCAAAGLLHSASLVRRSVHAFYTFNAPALAQSLSTVQPSNVLTALGDPAGPSTTSRGTIR